jgi:hypothetical protein
MWGFSAMKIKINIEIKIMNNGEQKSISGVHHPGR